MIEIRELRKEDMREAVELRVLCWTEELNGRAENALSVSKEMDYWMEWMHTAEEHNDIRLLIGAFENDRMLGVAFGSFAEAYDIPENGIELNGLWVYPNQRNRGISLMLLTHLIDFYLEKGMEKMIIYNHHYSPSNSFYERFGAQVVKQVYQMDGKLRVDVLIADMQTFKRNMDQPLRKYLDV